METNYPYVYARLRGMKSRFLPREEFERLLDLAGWEDVAQYLTKTSYARDIEAMLLRYPDAVGIEEGLRSNLKRDYNAVVRMLTGPGKEIIRSFMRRYEVRDIKTILRGHQAGVDEEQLKYALYAIGEFSPGVLQELAKPKDVLATIDMLLSMRHPFGSVLKKAVPQYSALNKLFPLEHALDKYYYKMLYEAVEATTEEDDRTVALPWMRQELLVTNVLMVIRLFPLELDLTDKLAYLLHVPFAPGRRFYEEVFKERELYEAVRRAMQPLKSQDFLTLLDKTWAQGTVAFEKALEETLQRREIKLFYREPLTLAPVLAYLYAKRNEVVNLRALVYGLKAGLPKDRIESELLYV